MKTPKVELASTRVCVIGSGIRPVVIETATVPTIQGTTYASVRDIEQWIKARFGCPVNGCLSDCDKTVWKHQDMRLQLVYWPLQSNISGGLHPPALDARTTMNWTATRMLTDHFMLETPSPRSTFHSVSFCPHGDAVLVLIQDNGTGKHDFYVTDLSLRLLGSIWHQLFIGLHPCTTIEAIYACSTFANYSFLRDNEFRKNLTLDCLREAECPTAVQLRKLENLFVATVLRKLVYFGHWDSLNIWSGVICLQFDPKSSDVNIMQLSSVPGALDALNAVTYRLSHTPPPDVVQPGFIIAPESVLATLRLRDLETGPAAVDLDREQVSDLHLGTPQHVVQPMSTLPTFCGKI